MRARSTGAPASARWRDLALGLGYVGLVLLLGVGTWLAYNQVFADRAEIRLQAGTIGNALQKGSDVKLHGVPVGKVRSVEPRPGGSELTLALDPAALSKLPAHTTARLLPKTLFGERYVSLVVPANGSGASGDGLEAGDTIRQDSSAPAVELEELFDEMLPVLRALQPDKLSATLGELVQMLRGNGADIGETMAAWGRYLARLNPLVPKMADDLASFGRVAQTYADAAPALVEALTQMTTTSRTFAQRDGELRDLYAAVVVTAKDTESWLRANDDTIITLSSDSREALQAVSPYATQFPCLFKALRDFIPVMDKTLGKGTARPGVQVVLNVTPSRGRYVLGKDDPTYVTTGRPRCPYQDGSVRPVRRQRGAVDASPVEAGPADGGSGKASQARGRVEPERIAPPPSSRVRATFESGLGLGAANSPGENQLIAELMAAESGLAPADYPQWASLVLGPVLRGTEVEVK